jgi:hypothetical protein
VIYNVLGQGAEEGEVRDYPAEGKGSAWVKLTMGREMVARRREEQRWSSRLARTRGRGEKGRGALVWPAKEKNGRGEENGALLQRGTLLSGRGRVGGGEGRTVRGRPLAAVRSGEGRGASAAVGQRGVADSGAQLALKQGRRGTARWCPGTVTGGGNGIQRKRNQIQFNSNDFKLL